MLSPPIPAAPAQPLTVTGVIVSPGQVVAMPLQVSAGSHKLTLARQTEPLATLPSAGHGPEEPVQSSTASHTPAAIAAA